MKAPEIIEAEQKELREWLNAQFAPTTRPPAHQPTMDPEVIEALQLLEALRRES